MSSVTEQEKTNNKVLVQNSKIKKNWDFIDKDDLPETLSDRKQQWDTLFDRFNNYPEEDLSSDEDVDIFHEYEYSKTSLINPLEENVKELEVIDKDDDEESISKASGKNLARFTEKYSKSLRESFKDKDSSSAKHRTKMKISGSMTCTLKSGNFSNLKSKTTISVFDMNIVLSQEYLEAMQLMTGADLQKCAFELNIMTHGEETNMTIRNISNLGCNTTIPKMIGNKSLTSHGISKLTPDKENFKEIWKRSITPLKVKREKLERSIPGASNEQWALQRGSKRFLEDPQMLDDDFKPAKINKREKDLSSCSSNSSSISRTRVDQKVLYSITPKKVKEERKEKSLLSCNNDSTICEAETVDCCEVREFKKENISLNCYNANVGKPGKRKMDSSRGILIDPLQNALCSITPKKVREKRRENSLLSCNNNIALCEGDSHKVQESKKEYVGRPVKRKMNTTHDFLIDSPRKCVKSESIYRASPAKQHSYDEEGILSSTRYDDTSVVRDSYLQGALNNMTPIKPVLKKEGESSRMSGSPGNFRYINDMPPSHYPQHYVHRETMLPSNHRSYYRTDRSRDDFTHISDDNYDQRLCNRQQGRLQNPQQYHTERSMFTNDHRSFEDMERNYRMAQAERSDWSRNAESHRNPHLFPYSRIYRDSEYFGDAQRDQDDCRFSGSRSNRLPPFSPPLLSRSEIDPGTYGLQRNGDKSQFSQSLCAGMNYDRQRHQSPFYRNQQPLEKEIDTLGFQMPNQYKPYEIMENGQLKSTHQNHNKNVSLPSEKLCDDPVPTSESCKVLKKFVQAEKKSNKEGQKLTKHEEKPCTGVPLNIMTDLFKGLDSSSRKIKLNMQFDMSLISEDEDENP